MFRMVQSGRGVGCLSTRGCIKCARMGTRVWCSDGRTGVVRCPLGLGTVGRTFFGLRFWWVVSGARLMARPHFGCLVLPRSSSTPFGGPHLLRTFTLGHWVIGPVPLRRVLDPGVSRAPGWLSLGRSAAYPLRWLVVRMVVRARGPRVWWPPQR